MSNSTYGKVWIVDTIGIITRNPVTIRSIIMFPNTAADTATLYYWDTSDVISAGCETTTDSSETGTITGTDTLTISGGALLPSTITDGSIFEITKTTGDTTPNVPMLIKTGGNDTVVVIHKIPASDVWTTEATKEYTWKTYQNRLAFHLISSAQKDMPGIDFGPGGQKFPNLALETITSEGNTKIYIYLN